MKKTFIVMMITLIVSGCGKVESNEHSNDKSTTTTEASTTTTTTSTTTTKETTKSPAEKLIGKFKDTVSDGSVPSEIEFKKNNKFSMTLNLCEGMATIKGTYKVKGSTITLSFKAGQFSGFAGDDLTTLKFKIVNDKKLKFTSDTVCCGPYKNNTFKRK